MKARLTLAVALSAVLLVACGGSSNSDRAKPTAPSTNPGGTPVTGVLTARFDPSAGVLPSATNLAFQGTTDLTLNPPVADPNNFGDPTVAVSALDGWSTVTPVTTTFNAAPATNTLVPGQTVRMFEVTLTGPAGAVTGITRELAGGTEFVVAPTASDASGRTIAIVPTRPLKQMTTYLAVLTDGIADSRGNAATPDQVYFFTKSTTALCVNGQSTVPTLTNAQACALEPLRQLTNAQEAVLATAAGIPRERVVLSWTFTTQSITPVLQTVRAAVQPAPVTLAPSGLTIAAAGLPPIADIVVGTIDLPYYLRTDQQTGYFGNLPGPLAGFWRAPACGTVPSCAAVLGPNNPSTNLTFLNRMPVQQATVKVPLLMTVPNAASGRVKPPSGWPLVIFQHGITRNRSDALAISATFAQLGFAVVAIDQPLHGITPADTALAPFRVNNTPFFALGARERTFDVDYVNNTTGAAGPDGQVDPSGTHFINLSSLLTSRDNLRQAIADLFVVKASVPNMTIPALGLDFDPNRVMFVGQSLGAMAGTSFLSIEPTVGVGVLSVPGGGIAQLLNGSASFGPRIRAGLAASGVQAGTPDFDRFMGAAQMVVDSGDPLNLAANSPIIAAKALLLHEVVGGASLSGGITNLPDQVVPNTVPGAPLSGTEPLIRALGLSTVVGSTGGNPLRGAVRFIKGEHGSLLSPARSAIHPPADPVGFLDVTTEMQGQMASFVFSNGTAVQVGNTAIIRTQ